MTDTILKQFPTLYKKSQSGPFKLQQWGIWTEDNVIVTQWGQKNGALQVTRDEVKEGKNPGKKNATTPIEQAQKEAEAKWTKQLKKGYVQSKDDAVAGKTDEVIEGGVTPMLAHRYDEQGEKIKFPAYVQPKFDGHRCIATIENGKASLWTRTRKPITGLPHIVSALENTFLLQTITLDGELYNHHYRNNFEELSSFIRTPEPKPGHEVVQYHIYDVVESGNQARRFDTLASYARLDSPGPLVRVETVLVTDEDEMMSAFERFLSQGYEGLMVRNASGLYIGKRSYDLQKVKEFMDSEFRVIGVEEGRGKLAGHAIFVCVTSEGNEFRVKMKGETAALKQYIENPALAIGRQLTVKFQGYTKYGVPRFPVGLRFKEEL